jgi:CheY-like chemotaxis protein
VVFKAGATRTRELMLTPGEYCCVSVIDTGKGIDESIRSKIFEPFFTTKQPGEGVGLGLSSVYGTVKSHNGTIELQSRVDAGSTFMLYLPVTDAPVPKTDPAPAVEDRPVVGRVLLVDDDQSVRELIRDMLEELGYTVACCVDGLDAVDYFKKHHEEIDIVLLDMLMPRMGGHDCFVELRRIAPDIKVVISTGYSLEGDPTKMLKEGAVAFLQKPYSIDDLDNLLQGIMRKGTPS